MVLGTFSFLFWFVSQLCLSDLSLSRNICWKKTWSAEFREKYCEYLLPPFQKICKVSQSFLASRKSIKKSSDVRYGKNSRRIGKGNQRKCGDYYKTINLFVKNVMFPFIVDVSKYFILVIYVYKDFQLDIAIWD